jgi:hypothetical protein
MTTAKKPRIRKTVSLDADAWSKIDEIRFNRRIRREADAITLLINAGYESLTKNPAPPDKGAAPDERRRKPPSG